MKICRKLFLLSIICLFIGCLCCSCINDNSHTHRLKKTEAKQATCMETGNMAYWSCTKCGLVFSDENGRASISLEDTILQHGTHELLFHPKAEGQGHKNGYSEHWSCMYCERIF